MCDNQFPFHPMQRLITDNTPPEWFTVFQGNPEGQEPCHFCSTTCINQWTIKGHPELPSMHLAHVGEQGPRERAYFEAQGSDHEPYRFCCEKHYPLWGNK